MFITFIQSVCLGWASYLLLASANLAATYENITLSVAVLYSYWISENLHRPAFWLPLIMIAGALSFSPNVHSVLLICIAFLTIGYFLQYKFSLRKIPVLKNLTVAICWSLLVAIPDTETIFELGGSVFFTTLALTLCIDFVQRKEDEGKVETVPHLIGNNLTLFFALIFTVLGHLFLPTTFFVGIFALAVQAVLTYLPKEKQREALRELPFLAYALGIYFL